MTSAKSLTIASIILGAVGLAIFILYKSQNFARARLFGYTAKATIALGIFLLALAVLELADDRDCLIPNPHEGFCSSYCSASHDPDSEWSYKAYCGPPPS